MYFPRCFFIRSVENITTTFSEFLFQYFRFFVSFLLSSLDVNIVLLNFKETTLKYSPRQNFVFDLESINWCDQIVEELSLIQSRIIVALKLMIISLLTVLYVGKTQKKIKNCEWEMFLFFICPQLVKTGQLLDSQCYILCHKHPDFHCLSTVNLLPYMWASFYPLDPSRYLSSFSSWRPKTKKFPFFTNLRDALVKKFVGLLRTQFWCHRPSQ